MQNRAIGYPAAICEAGAVHCLARILLVFLVVSAGSCGDADLAVRSQGGTGGTGGTGGAGGCLAGCESEGCEEACQGGGSGGGGAGGIGGTGGTGGAVRFGRVGVEVDRLPEYGALQFWVEAEVATPISGEHDCAGEDVDYVLMIPVGVHSVEMLSEREFRWRQAWEVAEEQCTKYEVRLPETVSMLSAHGVSAEGEPPPLPIEIFADGRKIGEIPRYFEPAGYFEQPAYLAGYEEGALLDAEKDGWLFVTPLNEGMPREFYFENGIRRWGWAANGGPVREGFVQISIFEIEAH